MVAYIKKPKPKKNSYRAKERHKYYAMKEWRNLRDLYIMEHPICEECIRHGQVTEATEVHHINSFMDYGLTDNERLYRLLDYTNLMALCRECHNRIHAEKEKMKKKMEKTPKS